MKADFNVLDFLAKTAFVSQADDNGLKGVLAVSKELGKLPLSSACIGVGNNVGDFYHFAILIHGKSAKSIIISVLYYSLFQGLRAFSCLSQREKVAPPNGYPIPCTKERKTLEYLKDYQSQRADIGKGPRGILLNMLDRRWQKAGQANRFAYLLKRALDICGLKAEEGALRVLEIGGGDGSFLTYEHENLEKNQVDIDDHFEEQLRARGIRFFH